MRGSLVIDERWRLPLVDVRLRNGLVTYVASSLGPLPACAPGRHQFVLLGDDGVEVGRCRVFYPGWDAVAPTSRLTVEQPVRVFLEGDTPW